MIQEWESCTTDCLKIRRKMAAGIVKRASEVLWIAGNRWPPSLRCQRPKGREGSSGPSRVGPNFSWKENYSRKEEKNTFPGSDSIIPFTTFTTSWWDWILSLSWDMETIGG